MPGTAADASIEPIPEAQPDEWQEWTQHRSTDARDRLVNHYLPLAKMVAGRLYRTRAEWAVPYDDFLQYARVGLIEAVDAFDPARGTPFQAYAFHRVRGSILNGLARESELAAQREAGRRIRRERRESLLGGSDMGAERTSLDDLIKLTVGLALGALLEGADEAADESPDTNPYAATEVMQLRRLVSAAVENLPQRERNLIRAHYYEQREFRELAEQWSLSKGRVSQLHSHAIELLQQLLAAEPKVNRCV
jgi:RNA polymerase sigma factor FliA